MFAERPPPAALAASHVGDTPSARAPGSAVASAFSRWMRRWLFPKVAEPTRTFERELESQINRVLLPGALLTLTAWLPYVWLDQALSPNHPALPYLRIGLTIVSATILALRYFVPSPPRATLLAGVLVGYLEAGAGFMAGLTGATSEYVGGFVFLIMLAPALPLPRRYAWRCIALSSLTFWATAIASGARFERVGQMYSLTDLGVSTIAASFLVWVLDATRERSWRRSTRLASTEARLHDSAARATALERVALPPLIAELATTAGVRPTVFALADACVVVVQPIGLRGLRADTRPLVTWRALELWLAWTEQVMKDGGFSSCETLDGGRVFIAEASSHQQGDDAQTALVTRLPQLHTQMSVSGLPAVRIQVAWRVGPVGIAEVAHRRFAFDMWEHTVYQATKVVTSSPHLPQPEPAQSEPAQSEHAPELARQNPIAERERPSTDAQQRSASVFKSVISDGISCTAPRPPVKLT